MKTRIILITWVNRLLILTTLILLMSGYFKVMNDPFEYNTVYGLMLMVVLGVFQVIVAMINGSYVMVDGRNIKMLRNYTNSVFAYIIIPIVVYIIAHAVKFFLPPISNFNDNLLQNLAGSYIFLCPILIALYFTLYLEKLKKEVECK